MIKRKGNSIIVLLSSILLISLSLAFPVSAEKKDVYPSASYYELAEKSHYNYNGTGSAAPSYGSPIGKLKISGNIKAETTFRGTAAYNVDENVTVGYEYNGSYKSNASTDWNLESDSGKSAAGYNLGSEIKKGVLLIEKSSDGQTWNLVSKYTDFFVNNPSGINDLFKTTDDEIISGVYIRITVAYKMERETGKILWAFPQKEHKEFVEVYKFYVLKDSNPVVIRDIVSRGEISSTSSTEYGFYVDKSGSTCNVTVTKDGIKQTNISDGASFTEQGIYTIDITSNFGTKYSSTVEVQSGLKFKQISPNVFETNGNYSSLESLNGSKTVFNTNGLTSLLLSQKDGNNIVSVENEGPNSYGISGDSFWIFIKLNHGLSLSNGWSINADKYGKYEGETIRGTTTGQVGTGAVIVQTSKDSIVWEDASKDKYANGLYTTDFCSHYAPNSEILLYMPSGNDIINGVYIRISFIYEVINGKETKNYLEEYYFYLCNESLQAITIHNKSIENSFSEYLTEEDKNTADLLKYAETLTDNTLTVTGFEIDKSKNPTVSIEVYKNDVLITGNQTVFTETGRYDIWMKSKVGTQDHCTIFVDTDGLEEAYSRYFGSSLITEDSKRIYNANVDYPTFEAGKTFYHINPVSKDYLPVSGVIKNISRDGADIVIDFSRTGVEKKPITIPGEYVAELRVNPSFYSDTPCGDIITFTFHFYVIAEGTAPGPKVNQESLAAYSHKNVSDSKPIYYGVTYQSAAKGQITIAFSTREEAIKYAREYEKGFVEKQEDGSFRYTGSMIVSQKQKINSSWDLADAIDYFAKQAVQELYFDLSDNFTFTTLTDEDISKINNLRTLELQESIVIFGDNQKEQLTSFNSLPLISPKPQRYLSLEKESETIITYGDFQFVRDRLGIDSDSVIITDIYGKEYVIEYSKNVGEQLSELGCPSGIITITESTKYGDKTEYKAVYIKQNEIQTEIEITSYSKENATQSRYNVSSAKDPVFVDAFCISKIEDALDDYPLVIVLFEEKTLKAYSSDSVFDELFTTPGNYTVKCVNRLGTTFEVPIVVNTDTGYSVSISFSGAGTEGQKPIIVYPGQTNVVLPTIERYGYILEGFSGSDGNTYTGEIEKILSKSDMVLEACWRAKQYKVRFVGSDDRLIGDEITVSFGDTISLPTPEFDDPTIRFVSWTCDGVEISESAYSVSREGDLVFKAKVENNNNQQNEGEPTDKSTENQNKSISIGVGIAAGVALIVVLIVFAVIRANRRKGEKYE